MDRTGTRIVLLVVVFLLTACGSEKRDMGLKKSLYLYDSSLRWGDFDKAKKLQKNQANILDYDFLRDVKVTSIEEKERKVSEDGLKVDRVIEIRYFNSGIGLEKIILDRETWRYDSDRELWSLDGELPDFGTTSD